MKEILHKVILSNSIQSYLIVLGVILFALIVKRYVSKYVAGLFFKLIQRANKTLQKDMFCNLIVEPLEIFLLLLVAFAAIDRLYFPKVFDTKIFKTSVKDIVDGVGNGVLVAVFIWVCLRLIDFVAIILEEKANKTDDQADNQLVVFFRDFIKVIVAIIGVLMILHFSFHKNIGNLLTGLSIVGAAIALATRESLENLIASFIIFFDKPFVTGDVVKVQNITGTIEKIGLRSTRIRTEAKTYITVPNKQMVDSITDNLSLRTQRHVDIKLEIGLDASLEKLQLLSPAIKTVLSKHTAIENYSVYLMETGKNAHVFDVDYFTNHTQSISEFNELKEQINLELLQLLKSMNLELAASSTDVKIHQV